MNGKVTFATKNGVNSGTAPIAAGLTTSDQLVYVVTLQGSACLCGSSITETATLVSDTGITHTDDNYEVQDALDAAIAADNQSTGVFGYGPDGLFSMIKTAVTDSYYGVSCSKFPTVISPYKANMNDYLTKTYLESALGHVLTQHGPRRFPDTALLTNGVINGYFYNLQYTGKLGDASATAVVSFNRDGGPELREKVGDWEGIDMGYRGRKITGWDSPLLRKKTALFLKTRDKNLRRLVPPPITGAQGQPQFQDVSFIMPIGGGRGIWGWAHESSGKRTHFLEAPYVWTAQHFIRDPQMLWLRNCKEKQGL